MKAARSSETSGTSNPATQLHVSEDMGPAGCGYLGWLNTIRMNPLFAFCVRCTVGTSCCRLRLKCDGTCAETRFRLSAEQTSPFKSAGGSVQSTTGSRGVRFSGSNAGYTKLRDNVKGTGYPLHSPIFPSLPLPCVTVCHHVSTRL